MRKKRNHAFLNHLEKFVNEYLPHTKGLSKNTIISYKTTFKLLMMFLYEVKSLQPDEITFLILDTPTIIEFLSWLENDRGCSPSTRNQRLAALYSFSEFAQRNDFDAASVFRTSVMRIPVKKTPKKKRVGFTVEELKILLSLPDQKRETSIRDAVLLHFMYTSGARAQEVCDLCVKDIHFQNNRTTVDILGKGSKARRVLISPESANMLKKYIERCRIADCPNAHVFSSIMHEHMTVSCVEEIFKKYIKMAKNQYPNLFQEGNYSPHCMRHTTAQHMMEAGVPIMVIKTFLGHESITTTQIYLENTQASIDKHVKEWNQKHFNVSEHSTENDENKLKIPTFLNK